MAFEKIYIKETLHLKKFFIVLCSLLILVGCIFGYSSFKKSYVKNEVLDFLINEKMIKKDDIEEIEPFIANLSGDQNFMVYVKLKNNPKKYYYYKNSKKGKVILESYELDGEEYFIDK